MGVYGVVVVVASSRAEIGRASLPLNTWLPADDLQKQTGWGWGGVGVGGECGITVVAGKRDKETCEGPTTFAVPLAAPPAAGALFPTGARTGPRSSIAPPAPVGV